MWNKIKEHKAFECLPYWGRHIAVKLRGKGPIIGAILNKDNNNNEWLGTNGLTKGHSFPIWPDDIWYYD